MKTILVLENNEHIASIVTLMLELEGFEVLSFRRVTTFAEVQLIQPSLILFDNWLFPDSGEELCKALKNSPTTKHIPLILFSASSKVSTIATTCGADDVIEKPFDYDFLIEKIRHHLN